MTKRVTIIMDDTIYEKLRKVQGRLMSKDGKSHSLSEIVNEVLIKGLK